MTTLIVVGSIILGALVVYLLTKFRLWGVMVDLLGCVVSGLFDSDGSGGDGGFDGFGGGDFGGGGASGDW